MTRNRTTRSPPSRTLRLGNAPKSMPAGRIVVHNRLLPVSTKQQRMMMHGAKISLQGFRAWTVDINHCRRKGRDSYVYTDDGAEVTVNRCRGCGWAEHLKEHYRAK
jgi:hypothetical protein